MACVAVNSLMRTIELEFLQPRPRPILQEYELISPRNKELIQSLHGKLGFLMEFFDESRMDGVEAIKHLETRLKDVAFRVEDEIEVQVVDLYKDKELKNPQWGKYVGKKWNLLRLHHILKQAIQDIDKIKEELVKVKNKYEQNFKDLQQIDVLPKADEVTLMGDSTQHASNCKEKLIGNHSVYEAIKEMLIKQQSKQREIVLIKGMGGIGKTLLARRVYEDPSVKSRFDKQAWVVASQHHVRRQMLAGLLNSIGIKKPDNDEDQASQLYQSLKHQRYLVVIDDVWSREAWDDVQACFPDDENHSRVLLTTRNAEAAKNIASSDKFSQQMDLLDQRESWDLFCEKTCKSGVEFEKIGRPIVDRCKGLPLAIVVVAGLFSKLNTLDEWKNIVEVLNSTTTTIDEECSRIFSLSYNHLPHNLKACFLYLGVFPEDHEIYANELARLWYAEGLVREVKNESFFEVANRYIQELMDRNLIILSKLSCCGRKIKKFRMHDLLHAFCEREAQNENLLHVVTKNGSNFPKNSFRWVSIQSVDFDMSTLLSCSKSCRSFFGFMDKKASLNFKIFNLLRVLYMVDAGQFIRPVTVKIGDVVHLRYLLSEYTKNVEMAKAWNLQTLKIREVEGNFLEFPRLQHIYCDTFDGNLPKCIDVFSWLEAEYCTKEYITNIPYLKKAHINIPHKAMYCIKVLVYLEQLDRLFIHGNGPLSLRGNPIVLFQNLRKLSIRDIGFYWEEISALSKLPRLEVLKLSNTSIGTQWELSEEEIFSELIFLKIDSYDLEHWGAKSRHFPKLERLLLYCCRQLTEVPPDFAEISTLTSIKLRSCLPSAVESAKQIQDEQHDSGNDNMVVIDIYTEERTKREVEGLLRAKGLITDWWEEYYSRW